jgi:hypothetical protein
MDVLLLNMKQFASSIVPSFTKTKERFYTGHSQVRYIFKD